MGIGSVSTEQLLEQLKGTLQLSRSMATAWTDGATLDCAKGIKHYEESLPVCFNRNGSVFARLHLGLRHYSTNSQRNYSSRTRWAVGNEIMHYTGDRHRLPSVKHMLLHIGQHRLDPRLDGRLLCQYSCADGPKSYSSWVRTT